MTINVNAEDAREAARTASGQFGVQEHSTPEADLSDVQSIDLVLSDLADQHNKDSYELERKAEQARLESFIADARQYVPGAVSARFGWDYEGYTKRLSFDCYLDENGDPLDDDSGEYPDINDFQFDGIRDAAAYGFTERTGYDGAVISFDDVPVRDEVRARAELAVATTLRDLPDGAAIRSMLRAAMGDEVPAERFMNLSAHDLEQVQAIFAAAVGSTANYLRHS